MKKISVIGACSQTFGRTVLSSLLNLSGSEPMEICLMSPHEERLSRYVDLANEHIACLNLPVVARFTTCLEEAVSNSDYIICLFNIGGFSGLEIDYRIPLKYGVEQCIGDTLGPGGIFRGLRSIPYYMRILELADRTAPEALVINYVNPMAMLLIAGRKFSHIRQIGLCHGVEETQKTVSAILNKNQKDLSSLFAGINHMTWMIDLKEEKSGEDLYPLFREKIKAPEWQEKETVRYEIMRSFGYFLTETSGHTSDLFPWFRKNEESRRLYCQAGGYSGESGIYYRLSRIQNQKQKRSLSYPPLNPSAPGESDETLTCLLNAMEKQGECTLYGNLINNPTIIGNLPPAACVEIPVRISEGIMEPAWRGDLPDPLSGLCMTNIQVQDLTVKAAISEDAELLLAALALDPLTSAVLNLQEIRTMAGEILKKERPFLPSGWQIRINDDIFRNAEK